MWEYGRHYCVESVDVKRRSFDFGIMVYFKQSGRASSKHRSIIEGNLQYENSVYITGCCIQEKENLIWFFN